MTNDFTNKYYIADKRWLAATSARAKETAKDNLPITDYQSEARKEWDEDGELLYAKALDEIERLQTLLAKELEITK